MLPLRKGTVLAAGDPLRPMQELDVLLGGVRRAALADVGLVGSARVGDEVVVSLGGGGDAALDLVHVNLTRGLQGEEAPVGVLHLPGTSLQHPVVPVEITEPSSELGAPPRLPGGAPVAVGTLHAQLAPLAWAFAEAAPGARLGLVQPGGGALPAALSATAQQLRERGLLAGHLTVAPCFGGDGEALTTAGALQHAFLERHWHAAVCLPGPAGRGTGSALGHPGMQALDTAHAAAALGCTVVVAARRSDGDPRPRHQGLSHHTRTLLRLALVPLVVATAGDRPEPDLRRHDWRRGEADLDGYAASGLPAHAQGRSIAEDPAFFAAALAAGRVLADVMRAA